MADEDNAEGSINILNDDCLELVFSQLSSIADKMRVERVSKRWQRVSQSSWKSVKALDLKRTTSMKLGFPAKKLAKRLNTHSMTKILRLCGGNLRRISTDNRKLSNVIIENAGKLCPNLEYVEIAGCTWTLKDTDRSLANCDKLVIKLFVDEQCFPRIFSRLTALRCLEIHGVCWTQSSLASGFHELPMTIQELVLVRVSVCARSLNHIIRSLPNLRSIELDSTSHLTAEFFTTVGSRQNLEQLKLYGPIKETIFHGPNPIERRRVYKEAIQLIATISSLEVLVFTTKSKGENYPGFSADPYITNELLAKIAKGCPELRSLDISGSDNVTDAGIYALAICTKLEELIIDRNPNVTDASLRYLTTLKVLQCVDCRAVKDTGMISLLRKATRLQVLNLVGTSITEATITVAQEINAGRNGRKLYLKWSGNAPADAPIELDLNEMERFQVLLREMALRGNRWH